MAARHSSVLKKLFGDVKWFAPPWVTQLQLTAVRKPVWFWSMALLAVIFISSVIAGYWYYQQLPKPLQVIAQVESPPVGHYQDNTEQPTMLQLHFAYDSQTDHSGKAAILPGEPHPDSMPAPTLSAARLDLIGEVLTDGVTISPAIAGKWLWQNENTLTFTPEQAWPAAQQYKVTLTKSLFAPDINLARQQYQFSTAPLTMQLQQLRFYQHPTDKAQRRIAGTLQFSHPVKLDSIYSRLTLTMRPDGADVDAEKQLLSYTLSQSEDGRSIYLQSEPLTLPQQEQYLTAALTEGVQARYGDGASQQGVSEQLLVPDQGSFLKVSELQADIVNNPEQQPEQMLLLSFTDRIDRTQLQQKLKLYLLPKHPGRNSYYWAPGEVNATVLQQASLLQWQLMPTPEQSDNNYSIKLDVPPGQRIFVNVEAGLRSDSDFTLSNEYRAVVTAPQYPKQAQIVGEGAVLSMAGEQKLQLLTRGIAGVRVRLHKLLPEQLNHFISQTSGDIKSPRFHNYSFDESNITTVAEKTFALADSNVKEANYLALPLTPYLNSEGMGVFFIELSEFDPAKPKRTGAILDKRVILVTDLGLLVKHNADSSQQVFVMSVAEGKPVAGATVALLGKNGQPLFTQTTDSQGVVRFGKTQQFEREQQPVVYLVTRKRDGITDSSFIPYDRYSRQLDYSKFNTSGSYQDDNSAKSLTAFLFSDRGIYRPGEQVQIAAIIRQGNLSMPQAKALPLQIQVEGPRGSTFWQQKFSLSGRGFHSFSFATQTSSETGRYHVSVSLLDKQGKARQHLGSVTVDIEEFQPDTLSISSTFNQQARGWLSPATLQAQIQLNNLFGTPAQQRNVNGRVELIPAAFRFDEYPDYQFVAGDKQDQPPQRQRLDLPQQQTDAEGQASFELPLQQYSGGTYQLVFFAEGFDNTGGRSVKTVKRAMVSPLQQLVGYKADGELGYLKKQQQRKLQFIALSPQLEQVAMSELTLKLIAKRPLSSLVKQDDGTFQYQSIVQDVLISEAPFAISKEGTAYDLPTGQPGDYELQLVNAQQQTVSKVGFTVVGNSNMTAMLEKNAALNVKLNKADYKPGEWIELTVTAPYTGSGLISIETDKIHTFSWFSSNTTSSIQRIQLPENLEGNAYINVSFVRSADSEQLFVSPLSYAVVPFNIDRSARELDITLQAPAEVRPGKPFTVGYKTDRPADLLIYGVDEGILQVAGYTLPDPLEHYLQKRALLVRSMQILDLILPEFSALQRQLAGVGGGMALAAAERSMLAKNLNPFARKLQQPGVFWLGIVSAGPDWQQQQVTVPQSFSGNIKLMAVAVGDAALGAMRQDLLVRGPFVISPDVLTTAAPGDEFDVTVGVANGVKGSGANADVTVRLQASEHLQIAGEASAKLQIGEGSEGRARFRVKALNTPSEAQLTFTAVYQQGELIEQASRSSSISIRPAQTYQTTVEAGYSRSGDVTLSTGEPLYPQLAQLSVTASANPLVLVEGLTNYLEQYPHGCTEQVVSQVFPWVGLIQQPAYQAQLPQLQQKFAVLVQKLAERQQSDGGFSFWPGGYVSADFPSIYVMHFLLEAKAQGLAVPDYLYQQGLAYLRNVARQAGGNVYQARLRANAIYLLTRSGEVTTNYLVELHERMDKQHQHSWHSDIAASYMAASYLLLQKPDIAQGLITAYRLGQESALQKHYLALPDAANRLGPFTNPTFQSQLSLDAQYIYLLAHHFADNARQLDGKQVLTLLQPVFSGQYNTIGAAYAVLGLSAYGQLQATAALQAPLFYATDENNNRVQVPLADNRYAQPGVNLSAATRKIEIQSEQPLFYALNKAGFAKQSPTEPVKQHLEIVRDYLNSDGKVVTSARQGEQLTVRLRLRSLNGQWLSNIAVMDLLPAGFEVIRSSVPRNVPRKVARWQAEYVDIREDRVVFYAGFGPHLTELNYQVKVTTSGELVVPAAVAESMYDRNVRASSVAGSIQITPASK